MSVVVILRGPSGVGKSTISRHIQEKLGRNWVVIDVDAFKHYVPLKEDNVNRAERTEIAHDVSQFFAKELYEKGYNVILEEMYRQKHNDTLLKFLDDNDMRYIKVFLRASLDDVISRSQHRDKKVPTEETRRLYGEVQPYEGDVVIDTSQYGSEDAAEVIIKKIQISS